MRKNIKQKRKQKRRGKCHVKRRRWSSHTSSRHHIDKKNTDWCYFNRSVRSSPRSWNAFFIYHFKDILYIDFTISSGSVDVTQPSYCLIPLLKYLFDTVLESLLFTKIENVLGILTCQRCYWRFIRTRNWRRIRDIRYEYLQLFDTSLIKHIDFLTFSNLFNDLEFITRSCFFWRFHLNWLWMIQYYV